MATREVRMLVGVSGYRHDGEKWPPAGGKIEVPDWEADDLIRGGNAIAVPASSAPEPVQAVTESRPESQIEGEALAAEADAAQAAQAEPEDEAKGGEADPEADPEGEAKGDGAEGDPDGGAQEPGPSAPAPSAPKQDWIDFAVQVHGADVHAATGMTKADLMSRYGGRL